MRVDPAVRALVRFAQVNLNAAQYGVSGSFDLIFCRNTLIYFEARTKERVVNRLIELVSPDGYLFLGHAESLTGLSDRVRTIGPTIYVPLGSAAPASAGWRSRGA